MLIVFGQGAVWEFKTLTMDTMWKWRKEVWMGFDGLGAGSGESEDVGGEI